MPTIRFEPSGLVVDYTPGETVFDVGQRSAVAIDTSCVGKGTCGLCRIKILEGEASLNPFSDIEQKHLGNVYFLTKIRLSCQTRPTGDIVVQPLVKGKKR